MKNIIAIINKNSRYYQHTKHGLRWGVLQGHESVLHYFLLPQII